MKRLHGDTVRLDVFDDGIGLADDFDIAESDTLGHTLVTGLSSQLNGEMTIDGTAGTRFSIVFDLEPIPILNDE